MSKLSEKVDKLLEEFFSVRNDLFIVSNTISKDNHIKIIIDGDQSICIQDCLDVSRKIEFNLDREEEDFRLDVSSFGIDSPLQFPRQYKKNINREIEVKTLDEKIYKGTIEEANEEDFTLFWKEKKGKIQEIVKKTFPYNIVKTTKIIIKF